MPNHFHILVYENEEGGISKFMMRLLTAYSMYFNTKYERSGPLFVHPFRSTHISNESQYLWIFSYIHLNPIKIIKNNFKNGTNGIFEITSLSSRHAAFAFRGWTNDYSNSRRESFEVEASTGQDVRLLMIKKMIALIRQHYQGDFNWESHRLDRVVIQSARLEDNAGLEDFMMMEFFGPNYKNSP